MSTECVGVSRKRPDAYQIITFQVKKTCVNIFIWASHLCLVCDHTCSSKRALRKSFELMVLRGRALDDAAGSCDLASITDSDHCRCFPQASISTTIESNTEYYIFDVVWCLWNAWSVSKTPRRISNNHIPS